MNTLQSLLNSTFVYRLGITLLHSLWEGVAVLVLLWIAMLMLRKASSQTRYAVSTAAMLLLAAMPIVTSFAITAPQVFTTFDQNSDATKFIASGNTPSASLREVTVQNAVRTPPTAQSAPVATAVSPTTSNYLVALPYIVATWLIGVAILTLWNLGGWIALLHLRVSTTQSAGADADRLMQTLARRLGITRSLRVLQSTLARTPMVIGALKPVILLPTSALTELSMAELESIIAHELAHIRRHDFVINLLQAVIETILFYHPAVWIISSRIRQERENCCDDLALSVTRDRASYVRALAAVASIRVSSLIPAASGGKLLPRLQRLLGITDATSSRPSRWTAGIVVLMLISAGGLFNHLRAADSDAAKDDDIIWIHGHVLDPAGKPVASAKIRTTGYSFREPISEAVSEADGSYRISYKKSTFADVRFGGAKTINVSATAPNFGPGWARPSLLKPGSDVDLKLAVDDVPVEGRIIDLEGRPVANARVRGWSLHAKYTDLSKLNMGGGNPTAGPNDLPDLDAVVLGPSRFTHTDADGRFKLTGFGRDREVDIMFDGASIANGFVGVNTRPGPKQTRTFQLAMQFTQTVYGPQFEYIATPGRIVRGTVRDAQTHEPLAGVRLSNGTVNLDLVSDAHGNYQINGYTQQAQYIGLTAWPSESQPYLASDADVNVKSGRDPTGRIDFDLHRGVVRSRVV